MKKLDEIPKKHPFTVPEGYFDTLPGIIQSRVAAKTEVREARPYMRYALQYALPVVVLAVVAFLYFMPGKPQDTESLLASVSTEQLIAYLEESDLTTEELLRNIDFDAASVEAIESEVYFSSDDFDDLLDDIDLNNF